MDKCWWFIFNKFYGSWKAADGIDGCELEINLVIREQNKQAHYSLQNNRKFDLKHLKALKAKEYVEKITV